MTNLGNSVHGTLGTGVWLQLHIPEMPLAFLWDDSYTCYCRVLTCGSESKCIKLLSLFNFFILLGYSL